MRCFPSEAIAAVQAMTLATGALEVKSSKTQYIWLGAHQLLRSTATATPVYTFITAQLDYCSTFCAGLPARCLGCLEWVVRTAARLIGGIPRAGHVSDYMPDVLHWLPLQQWIVFQIAALAVSAGSCSSLPAQSLLSHPRYQRSQLPVLSGSWGYFLFKITVLCIVCRTCFGTCLVLHLSYLLLVVLALVVLALAVHILKLERYRED